MSITTINSLLRPVGRLTALFVALVLPALAADPAPDDVQSRFEVDFITDLIDHHHSAAEMARLVETRTERPELREFASTLAADEAEKITTLQGWLKEWYGEDHEAELDRKEERELATLEELKGAEFEQAFLRALSLHHGETLVLARDGLLQAWHNELIDLTRETMATQSDEIALMRGWLLEWHDINSVAPSDRPDNRTWSSISGPRVQVVVPGVN